MEQRKRRQPPMDRTADPEIQKVYQQLLEPLSLFPEEGIQLPTTPEPLPPSQMKREARVGRDAYFMEQLSPGSLCMLVSDRLFRVGISHEVPHEDRQRLLDVILAELRYGWQMPPPEPSLSPRDQQTLRQRVETHVVLASEQLFVHYLHLLITLMKPQIESVLTEPATLTRLSAYLAVDCSRFLTSPQVYRSLVNDFIDLQGLRPFHMGPPKPEDFRKQALFPQQTIGAFQASRLCPLPWPHSTGFSDIPCAALNMSYLISLSRPAYLSVRPCPDALKGLRSIPDLDMKKYLRWLPAQTPKPSRFEDASAQKIRPSEALTLEKGLEMGTFLQLHIPRKCCSLPNMREGQKLSDELGICSFPPRTLTPLILGLKTGTESFIGTPSEDLKHMKKNLMVEWSKKPLQSSALPPLLGALTRLPNGHLRMEELQRILKTLQEEEDSGKWDYKPIVKFPATEHPQPVTVDLRWKDQTILKAAAARVSDRAFRDSFYLKEENVLYNHLSGELDGKAVEELDNILFAGARIQEIYKELLSRVSADYLDFDRGPLVEPTSDQDWTRYAMSGFLNTDPNMRIINPALDGIGKHRFPSLSYNRFAPLGPRGTKRWFRNKSSWLRWWRTTLTTDDYFLYLATQECDFLHVIFHMYPEDEPVKTLVTSKDTLQLPPVPPLGQEEDVGEFVPGFWDANSVLEYGLGAESSKSLGDYKEAKQLQRRLERIWAILQVPDKDRLDMAIKYSSNVRLGQLPALVSAWEKALHPIQEREILLAQLERFEQEASDPNRFFLKVDYDLWRLQDESQIRSSLYQRIKAIETLLAKLLRDIQVTFGDSVTYKGRCYLEKMKKDKVEMLYWLQQERRAKNLVRVQRSSRLPSLIPKITGNLENGLTSSHTSN
ncbi:coiled-coil domain-containing protein 87 [Antechinus flavipes]|uniref:coiled-coil domain-containing protein 87 n=1 Tax=Antechinus flavipes TaxID=38775 RepID=UPI0022356FE5|nr:coiled-coil domain-containing protein 87 [Antechinus flavipes]